MSEEEQKTENPGTGSEESKDLSVTETAGSVLAAIFGVQSNKNRERDFEKGDVGNFLGVFLVFAVIIIGALIFIANMAASALDK